MEQGKPGTSESVKHMSHSKDTKTLPEDKKSLPSSDKRDVPSNDMPHISASSPKARSKEAAEVKEEIPQINSGTDASEEKSYSGTKVKSPVETSNVAPENKAEIAVKVPSTEASMPIPHENECVGAEAKPLAGVPKPFTMEEIGKAMSDILPSFEVKTCVRAKADTSTIKHPTPLQENETGKENQCSPETKRKFLQSRIKYLKMLSFEMWCLKIYMEEIDLKIPLPECLDSDDEIYFQIWCQVFECYQTVQNYLERAIQMIRRILKNNVENVTFTDVQNFIDILSFLQNKLPELLCLCRPQPHLYRCASGDFPNSDIIFHLNSWRNRAGEVMSRVTFETAMFESFIITSDTESND